MIDFITTFRKQKPDSNGSAPQCLVDSLPGVCRVEHHTHTGMNSQSDRASHLDGTGQPKEPFNPATAFRMPAFCNRDVKWFSSSQYLWQRGNGVWLLIGTAGVHVFHFESAWF